MANYLPKFFFPCSLQNFPRKSINSHYFRMSAHKRKPGQSRTSSPRKSYLPASLIISFTFRREKLSFLAERNSSAQKKLGNLPNNNFQYCGLFPFHLLPSVFVLVPLHEWKNDRSESFHEEKNSAFLHREIKHNQV